MRLPVRTTAIVVLMPSSLASGAARGDLALPRSGGSPARVREGKTRPAPQPGPTPRSAVLLVEDEPNTRERLAATIAAHPELALQGSVGSCAAALRELARDARRAAHRPRPPPMATAPNSSASYASVKQ